jgi:hypothetical protein
LTANHAKYANGKPILFSRIWCISRLEIFVESKPTNPLNADAACDECGNFGALEIGDRKLCLECVALAGSSCAGSAADESHQR